MIENHRRWGIGMAVVAAAGTVLFAVIVRAYLAGPAAQPVPGDATAAAPAAAMPEPEADLAAAAKIQSAAESQSGADVVTPGVQAPAEQSAAESGADGLPVDIRQRVFADFGTDRGEAVYRELLNRIPEGLANGTRPRHLRCILYLAKGDEALLEKYIKICLEDTRDVMLQAEYEGPRSRLVRERDFARPFAEAEIPP